MASHSPDNEKTMALAFLRYGHPWLAISVIVIKAVAQVAVTATIVAGVSYGHRDVAALFGLLPPP